MFHRISATTDSANEKPFENRDTHGDSIHSQRNVAPVRSDVEVFGFQRFPLWSVEIPDDNCIKGNFISPLPYRFKVMTEISVIAEMPYFSRIDWTVLFCHCYYTITISSVKLIAVMQWNQDYKTNSGYYIVNGSINTFIRISSKLTFWSVDKDKIFNFRCKDILQKPVTC